MRFCLLLAAVSLALGGCRSEPGAGLWHLEVGGEAKLVSSDGSDITLETFAAVPAQGKTRAKAPKTGKIEQVKLPAGTSVRVLAIDGDDARVEIKDGSKAGSIYWVECSRLEAASK
jgi:hypothetical protein